MKMYNLSMSYLRRKADQYLKDWKSKEGRLPLIIRGARQIGKTETIRKFAAENYRSVVEINFVTNPAYKGITADGYSAESIVRLISFLNPDFRFMKGETLIFFDEIQEFPDIATSLKFFSEDGNYDVICSGSLLGIQYKHISSVSVGYKIDYQMYSMDFEEFLWAVGYSKETIEGMLQHMLTGMPFSALEQNRYTSLFLDYCVLGGMPRIVSTYLERKSFEGSLSLQRQLLFDYEGDIRKYAEALDQSQIIKTFHSLPAQLAKENKKFQYARIEKGARAKDYRGCVEWLSDAGLVNICYCLNFPELPLKGNFDMDKFKVYFADTGFLVASLDDEAQQDLRANRNLGVYKGALYENFVAEALVKQEYELFYYSRNNSTLEEDFFIRSANELIPLEVKSNRNQSKAQRQLISSDRYPDIEHGIKLSAGNVGIELPIVTFPYYCAFLLRRYMNYQTIFK